eukprot:scaffold559303_cov33-Prasinocladus_malaysianus.AAC.1
MERNPAQWLKRKSKSIHTLEICCCSQTLTHNVRCDERGAVVGGSSAGRSRESIDCASSIC